MAEILNFIFFVEFHLDDVLDVLLRVGLNFFAKLKDKYLRTIH